MEDEKTQSKLNTEYRTKNKEVRGYSQGTDSTIYQFIISNTQLKVKS